MECGMFRRCGVRNRIYTLFQLPKLDCHGYFDRFVRLSRVL